MFSRVGLGLLLLVAACSFAWDDYDPRLGSPSAGGGTSTGAGGTGTGTGGGPGGTSGAGGSTGPGGRGGSGQGGGGQGGTAGSGGQGGSGDWFDEGLGRRRPLDVAWPDADSSVLTDFPVLVRLDGTTVPDLAGELRFVADDQTTPLAHEVEQLEPSGESLVWLKVPTLGADPLRLWLYYDGDAASQAIDPTDTWSNAFVGVWHLTESLTDSTALGNDAVGSGALPIEGRVGTGYSFDGDGDYLEIPADGAFDTLFVLGGTASVLIRPASHGEVERGRIIDRTTTATFDGGWSLLMSGYSTPGSVGWGYGYANAWGWWTTPQASVTLDSWVHVAASFTETVPLAGLYLDGVPQTVVIPNPPAGASNAVAGVPIRLGGRSGEIDRDYQGDIDEVRLASEVRSDEWLAAEAASMSGALVTVGAAESRP